MKNRYRKTCVLIILLCLMLLSGCKDDIAETVRIINTVASDVQRIAAETPSVTALPTVTLPMPTAEPTAVPTVEPTPQPSPLPTAEPTPPPIAAPTPVPLPVGDSFLTGSRMAAYLRLAPFSVLSNDELRTDFLKAVTSRLVLNYSINDTNSSLIDPVIFSEPSNTGFLLECVDVSGLTDAGTFDVFPDSSMQLEYLTEVNCFSTSSLSDLSIFGGTKKAAPGDIIFWLDETGKGINYSIILEYQNEYMCIALARSTGICASFVVYSGNVSERFISQGIVVHLAYPCIEQTVFLFLTNEMGYSPAAACGVMANIYYESSFRSKIDVGSYGLCQWQGNRRAALINWCKSMGLDYSTVKGQLEYLSYEVITEFPELSAYMSSLGNTKEDATNGARQWCYKYEQPGQSDAGYTRGKLAKDSFYPIYSQY